MTAQGEQYMTLLWITHFASIALIGVIMAAWLALIVRRHRAMGRMAEAMRQRDAVVEYGGDHEAE